MGEICVQCGDIGFKKKLIYCFKCTQSARHSYCMDELLPKSKLKTIRWLCDECISSSAGITNPGAEEGPVIVYAEPMIRSVWAGSFHMLPNDNRSSTKRMEGVHAFLSSKACMKVRETFDLFGDVLRFEVVARKNAWPKSFVDAMGPTDDHIGVYFFPLLGKEEEYNQLVWGMFRDDLAMRSYVPGDAQLLVFPSTELPRRAWRFQGRLYLWGVFKGKLPSML